MAQITRLKLVGWKSIREADIEFRPINVMVGANGAGKSNLIGFLNLLHAKTQGRFSDMFAREGGAASILHFGAKQTLAVRAEADLSLDGLDMTYIIKLLPFADNTLKSGDESLRYRGGRLPESPDGHRVSENIVEEAGDIAQRLLFANLSTWRSYHFLDTTFLGPLRKPSDTHADTVLRSDGSNLATILRVYANAYPTYYRRMLSDVREVVPDFDTFVLEPDRLYPQHVSLRWRLRGSPYELGAHQLSDGSLRAIALIALLGQRPEDFASLTILDEPELGLHPTAVGLVADRVKSAAANGHRFLIATQSPAFVDRFAPEDILVVDRGPAGSTFSRLDPDRLTEWMAEYTLGQLWEKNVIGGGTY